MPRLRYLVETNIQGFLWYIQQDTRSKLIKAIDLIIIGRFETISKDIVKQVR